MSLDNNPLNALTAAMAAFDFSCASGASIGQRQDLLRSAMRMTPHGPASNTLEHGIDCARRYRELLDDLASDRTDPLWPQWLQDHGKTLLKHQIDPEITLSTLTHHDCGKPSTMTVDADGRHHFPGHAEESARIWALAGGAPIECELMAKDMLLHTASSEEAAELAKDPLAMTLLLCAHVEIESNACSVFGGVESTSYKIKRKALGRRANALLKALEAQATSEHPAASRCQPTNQRTARHALTA